VVNSPVQQKGRGPLIVNKDSGGGMPAPSGSFKRSKKGEKP